MSAIITAVHVLDLVVGEQRSSWTAGSCGRRPVLAVTAGRLRDLSAAYGKLAIAVAGAPDKPEATLGAMRGRFANVRITDKEAAAALLS